MVVPKANNLISMPKDGFVIGDDTPSKTRALKALKQLAKWAGHAKFTASAMSKVSCGDVALNTLSVDAAVAQLAALTNRSVDAPAPTTEQTTTGAGSLTDAEDNSEGDDDGQAKDTTKATAVDTVKALETCVASFIKLGTPVPKSIQDELATARSAAAQRSVSFDRGGDTDAMSQAALEDERKQLANALGVMRSLGTAESDATFVRISTRLTMVKSAIRARIEDTGTGGSATAAASKQSVAMSEAVMQRIDALQAQLAAGGALKSSQAATIPDRLIHGGRVSVSSFQSSGKLHPEDHKRALSGEYVSFYDAAKRSAGSTTALSGGRRDIVGSIDADNVVSLNAKATTSATDKCVDDPVFWTMHYAWIDARIQSRPELESE